MGIPNFPLPGPNMHISLWLLDRAVLMIYKVAYYILFRGTRYNNSVEVVFYIYIVLCLLELRFLYYSLVGLSRPTRMTILVVPHKHSFIFHPVSICEQRREEAACGRGYTHTPRPCHHILWHTCKNTIVYISKFLEILSIIIDCSRGKNNL